MKTYFQIGTNDGNDGFRRLCIKDKPDIIILVEPNIKHLSAIQNNYKGFPVVHIFNNAIYYQNDEEVELFIPAKDGIYGLPGVQPDRKQGNHTYTDGQFSLLPMNDWGEKKNMCSFKTKTITFDTICEKLNIKDIEFLQIDTEGFDTEIIRMIDLNKYNIRNIRYEKWSFSTECFTKYHNDNNNLNNFGIQGMKFVEQKLVNNNYVLRDICDQDGDDIIATKLT
jgi:FkbM family methyltransferase